MFETTQFLSSFSNPNKLKYNVVGAGAAPPLVVLGHIRGWWGSEQAVHIVGAAIYCAQLVPPPMVNYHGTQLCEGQDHFASACQ